MDWNKQKEEYAQSQGNVSSGSKSSTGKIDWSKQKAEYQFSSPSSDRKNDDNLTSELYSSLVGFDDTLNDITSYYNSNYSTYNANRNNFYKDKANRSINSIDTYLSQLKNAGYGDDDDYVKALNAYKSDFQNFASLDLEQYAPQTTSSSTSGTAYYDELFKDVKDKNGVQAEKDKYQQLYDSATTWEEKYAYEDTLKYLDDKYYAYSSPAEIEIERNAAKDTLNSAKDTMNNLQPQLDSYKTQIDSINQYYQQYEMYRQNNPENGYYTAEGAAELKAQVDAAQAQYDEIYKQYSAAQNEVSKAQNNYDNLSTRLAVSNADKISKDNEGTELGLKMTYFREDYKDIISGEKDVEGGENGLSINGKGTSQLEKDMRKQIMAAGYSETEAYDWVESAVRSINEEINSEKIQRYYDNAFGSGIGKGIGLTALRTGANYASGFSSAGEAISQLFDKSNYSTYDVYDSNFLLSHYVNQTSQGIMDTHKYDKDGKLIEDEYDENGNLVKKNKKWEWDLPFLGKTDMFDTMYGILTSSADSMLAAAIGGGVGSALGLVGAAGSTMIGNVVGGATIGLQAGTQELIRLAEQGASKRTALTGGIVAGAFESLFETLSISQFKALNEAGVAFTKSMTKAEVKAACKEVAKNFAKSFITNASEEFNTELANVLFDAYANGAYSDYERLIKEYHMQHPDDMSEEAEEKAKEYALHELTKRIVEAGVTGGLQGLLMGGVGTVNGSVRESAVQNKFYAGYYNYGDQIRTEAESLAAENGWSRSDIDEYVSKVVAEGDFSKYDISEGRTAQTIKDTLEVNPDAKLANRYDGKISDGKALNAGQLNRLIKENAKENTKADQTKIENAVNERLTQLGETGDVAYLAKAITKQAMGKRLDAVDKLAINESKYAQRVINEVMPGNVINGEYASEWAGNIGTKVVNPGAYNKTRIMNQVRSIMDEDGKASKQSVEVKKADITRTGVPSIDAVVRQMVVDGKDSVSEGLVKSVINDSKAMEYLGIDVNGMSASNKRSAVKTALEELARKNAPKANDHSNTAAAVTEIANEYKGMSNAVISVYNLNPTADVETFAAEFKRAYELGRGEGNLKELNNIKTLTETQKRLAYAFGKAQNIKSQNIAEHEASKAFKETIEKGGTANKLNRKGKLTSTIPSKTINKLFQHGSNQKSAVQMLRTLAQITGFNIEIYDSKLVGAQGEFDPVTNTIRIDINAGIYSNMDVADLANYTMLRTFCHEFTHAGEKWAAEEYQILRAAIIEAYAQNENFDFDKEVDKQIAANEDSWLLSKKEQYINEGNSEEAATQMAEEWVENNKWDLGSREVVAESLVDILPESKFIENLYKKSPSVCQRITDALHRFIEKIQNYWSSLVKNDAPEANALKYEMEGTVRYLSDIVEKFDAMAEKAVENKRLAAEKYEQKMAMLNPKTVNARNISKEGWDSVKSSDGTNMFQLRTMRQDVDGYMQDLKDAGLVGEGKLMSEAELNELYKTINDTMDYVERNIDAIERSESFREMDGENRPFLPYKDNSDPHYKKALDFSTLCRKRLLTQAITEKLQRELKRALTPVEQVKIRNEIKKLKAEGKKLDVACALCYVEAARLKSPKVINEFLNNKTDSLKNYFSLKNSTFKHEVYEKKLGDWKEAKGLDRKATKDQIKAAGYNVNEFNKFGLEVRKGYWQWLEKANPEQFAKEQNIIDIANSMENAEFLSAENLAKMRGDEQLSILYDAFITKVRSATRSKAQETDVPYKRGDINQVGDAIIDQMNEESGFRHQSWSDFQAMHILDTMAAVIELATKNAKVHTYTKVTDMVRFLGDTGMMINMSLIPAGDTGISADGMIEFDPAEGMDFDEMLKLRDQYADTAGNIAIGISDEHILKLLDDPRIDYVIPYHVSGLNADMRKRMGIRKWTDYTKTQNEKGDGWDKKAPRLAEWFSESEAANYANAYDYMVEASKKYLQLCYERNLTPKFSQFLEKNSDGSYSLREDAQNYWKLLIDRKMVNHITQSIITQKAVKPSFNADTTLDILSNEVNSQAAIDAREAEKYIVNKMLTEPGTFTKKELEQARIVRDAAIRMAIEDISVEEMGVKQNQTRIKNTESVSNDSNIAQNQELNEKTIPAETDNVVTINNNGELAVSINTSDSILQSIRKGKWASEISSQIKDVLAGKSIEAIDGDIITITRRGAREVSFGTNSKELRKLDTYDDIDRKMITAEHLAAIISLSKYSGWSKNTEDISDTFKKDGINRRSVNFVINGVSFTGVVLTALNLDENSGNDYGDKFYDIVDIKEAPLTTNGTVDVTTANPHKIKYVSGTSRWSLSQKQRAVNNKSSSYSIGDTSNTGMADALRKAGVSQNQQRKQKLSDRYVLSQASQQIDRSQLTEEQAKALDTFDKYLAESMELRAQRDVQNELIRKYRKENNNDELIKAENRRNILSGKISRVDSKMLTFENTAVAKQILKKSREIIETAQDLETSERLEKYYSRQLERAAQNSEYDAERNKALKKKLAEVRADRDAQIAALKKAKNEKISNIIANKNQRIDEAIKEKRNILNEYKAEQRENMTARDIRNHIYSMAEEFRTMVTKPGKSVTRHAPVSLTSAIANFCDIFDENRYMRLQKNENTLAQRKKDYENGKSWDKDVDAEAVKIKNREEQLARQNAALDMLKLKYDALMKDELYNSYYDEHIAGMLTQAKESLTQKDLFEMTSKELTGIDNLMRALRKTVVDANKAVAMKKGQEISDIASRLAAQIDQAVPKKNNFGRTMQKYAMWQMRPDTFFSYITGYAKESVGEDVQQMFVDGTERMLTMQREYYHMMSKLTESKKQSVRDEMKKLMNDHKKLADWGLTDRNGNSVSTTRGMMLQAYMLLLQEDSFNSLVYGGFKIPRMDAYYKGNMSEAYSGANEDTLVSAGVYGDVYVLQDELNGIKDRQTQIEEKLAEQGITDEEKAKLKAENETISKRADELNRQIADIVSGAEARLYDMKFKIENMLTETEKEVLKVAREWYDYSGEKLDEVFLDLYGYVPIRPKNYTTIHRSLDTVQTDIRSVDMATNLENFGSAKERVKSKDPILLTDIFNELNGNVQRMSKYYGYVEAQKDFNRIWNYKTPGTQSSIKSKIAAKFLDGDNAVMPSGSQYIENYVKNISGANAEREGSSPFHALYSGLAGANLALNPRVALSQWASIPTAAAEVGWANMAKGFAKGFTGMFSTEYKRKLSENSVWYWQRYRGEGGITEVSDMMNSAGGPWGKFTKTKAGKAFLNWCQTMDTMATASMWAMAEEQAKQNGFKRGTEEFKAETEKVFRDIIRKTQPNYTTTERSDLLRDKRDSMKLLTMYKTQSNQNLNILMEATGKFRKMKQDLKNNANGVTKADVKAATKNLANAYTAVILGGSVAFAMLRSIVNIAFGKIRDDDDEFTAEALAESILKDTVSSMTGMFSIGSQVYDFILPIVSGDNYYGLSDSAFGAVSDILEQTVKIIQKAQDEDKEIDLKDINKETVAICSALGIPLRNAENIGKAIIMYVKDAKNGTFGTFEAGANRTKADELQRFLNGYLEENEEKIGRAEAGYLVLSGNDEKAFKSGLASKAKDWVKKGKLTTEQYEDILKNYLGYEDKDVEDKMHRINAELKLGSIKSDDWTDVFKTNASAEDIDYVVAEFGGNFKDSYKAYRNIGYDPEKAYDAAKALDGDNSGGVSQYEVYTAAQKLPKDKAEKLWNSMGYKEKYSEYAPGKTDSYKYDVKTSSTISSYNDKNWTNALTDKSISNDDLDTLILAYGGTKFQDPYKELRAKNYSPVAAYNILTAMDTDNSGGISQSEALAYIRSQKLSQADAEALWNMFGWTKSYQYYSSKH